MGDQAGVATQLAALLQCPEVLTALGAALAPFLAGAPPVAIDEGAATRSRSRSKRGKGGSRPAQPPPAPPTSEHAMIASLQRQIASLEGVINTFRRELAESRGEPALAASTRTGTATAAQAGRPNGRPHRRPPPRQQRAARRQPQRPTGWQLAGSSHSRRSKGAQEAPGAAPPSPPLVPMRVDGHRLGLPEPGAPRRVPLCR